MEFLEYYLGWAEPARRGFAEGVGASLPGAYTSIDTVVVCGMGGSGVVGEYLAAVSAAYGGVPVVVVKHFQLPRWVSRDVLLLAVSFSGNTSETLMCARQGLRQAARIVAVTTGGQLASLARREGLPLVLVEEAPAPRAGWPQLFYSLLGMLGGNGLLHVPREAVEESLRLLGERSEALKAADEVANYVVGEGVLVLVVPEPYYPVGVRARNEFAENGKEYIDVLYLPEAGHNMLEALPGKKGLRLLALDPGDEAWSTLFKGLSRMNGLPPMKTLRLRGGSLLARLVWGTWVTGLASIKAAILKGADAEKLTVVKEFRSVMQEVIGAFGS